MTPAAVINLLPPLAAPDGAGVATAAREEIAA